MRCLDCQYDLKNLTPSGGEHRCPECGRVFDPKNLTTVAPDRLSLQSPWPKIVAVVVIAGLAMTITFTYNLTGRVSEDTYINSVTNKPPTPFHALVQESIIPALIIGSVVSAMLLL